MCARCSEINRGGLPLLYEVMLETSAPELATALTVRPPNPSGCRKLCTVGTIIIINIITIIIFTVGPLSIVAVGHTCWVLQVYLLGA